MFEPKFFLGIVTDNNDPDKRGRVRIRIMGIHTEITQPMDDVGLGIEEKDLPLAQCMYPVTYTGTKGTCPPPSLLPGDWVLGVSLDGNAYQNLMILGLAKAKFNAESLADGSINAADAYATPEKPADDAAMAKAESEAKAEISGKPSMETASVVTPDMKQHEAGYEAAKETASNFASGTPTSGTLSTTPDTPQATVAENALNPIASTISPETASIAASAPAGSFLGEGSSGVQTKISPEFSATSLLGVANGTTIPYNTNAFNTALSVGNAVFNVVTYLSKNKSPKFEEFTKSSNLDINTDGTPNDIVSETLGEGYYEYCYNYFNRYSDNKSDILPTFAYSIGVGETEDYLMWYGDPNDKRCTYARMILNMRNDGLESEADYMTSVVQSLNKKNKTSIATIDPNSKLYHNHQHIPASKILSRKYRNLGTVVMPTLRSTISQSYIVLPNYSNENNFSHEHYGIDLCSEKIPVVSMADGVVTRVFDSNPEHCNAVVIEHSCDVKTLYMHMYPLKVKEGDRVTAGQIIGTANGYGEDGTDTTTPRLHFEVKLDKKLVDPQDFLVNKLGFYIRVLDTADMYKNDELSPSSDIYKKIKTTFRKEKNIAWSF